MVARLLTSEPCPIAPPATNRIVLVDAGVLPHKMETLAQVAGSAITSAYERACAFRPREERDGLPRLPERTR